MHVWTAMESGRGGWNKCVSKQRRRHILKAGPRIESNSIQDSVVILMLL